MSCSLTDVRIDYVYVDLVPFCWWRAGNSSRMLCLSNRKNHAPSWSQSLPQCSAWGGQCPKDPLFPRRSTRTTTTTTTTKAKTTRRSTTATTTTATSQNHPKTTTATPTTSTIAATQFTSQKYVQTPWNSQLSFHSCSHYPAIKSSHTLVSVSLIGEGYILHV